jgi:hypothetical protein
VKFSILLSSKVKQWKPRRTPLSWVFRFLKGSSLILYFDFFRACARSDAATDFAAFDEVELRRILDAIVATFGLVCLVFLGIDLPP